MAYTPFYDPDFDRVHKAYLYPNAQLFDSDMVASLIADEEKKLKLMAIQFPGANSLFLLQQKLIHALQELLGLLTKNASLQEIYACFHKVLVLYMNIDEKIAKLDRKFRLDHESELKKLALLEQMVLAAEMSENPREKHAQNEIAAQYAESRRRKAKFLAEYLAFKRAQKNEQAKFKKEQTIARKIHHIIERLLKNDTFDNASKIGVFRFSLALQAKFLNGNRVNSYHWSSPRNTPWFSATILAAHPHDYSKMLLQRLAKSYGFDLKSNANESVYTYFLNANPRKQVRIAFEKDRLCIKTNSLGLNNLELFEALHRHHHPLKTTPRPRRP